MSSSKEATKAVNLGGPIFHPLTTFSSRSKQTSSVAALQPDLRRRKYLSGGQSLEHLKAGGDPVKNLKGDPLKNEQHGGEDGLDWWEVIQTYIKCQIH